jgi:succinate-semialdehyde dehydrogenase/glutarate-semialdehyde dehydrogenase
VKTLNPATGIVEQEFDQHDDAEVERRLELAHQAWKQLKKTTYAQRATWMNRAAELLEEDVEELAVMMTTEMGKPIAQARAEALKCAKNCRFYADNAEEFLADEEYAEPEKVNASSAVVRYESLGPVLAVMPWNFPFWQVIRFAAPALMAGNTGVLKHASNVPQAALYLDALFTRAGFPEGSFVTLMIGAAKVSAVIDDPRIKAVTLTGSEPAGRSVAERAGRQIKKAVLELGGSDPFIVMPSADLEQASTVAVTARMINNGQSCIAGKRFMIHEDVYDAFMEKFVSKVEALVVGDPSQDGVDIGPLATEGGVRDIVELVEDAKKLGATVLTGGFAPEGPGFYYQPTIMTDLKAPMKLVMEEAFGPVASVYKVSSREEAVNIANQVTFGLGSAIWSTDPDDHDFFERELDSGGVFVNGMTISYPELPFGGIKDSGYGRELGAHGIREFCNVKTIWRA